MLGKALCEEYHLDEGALLDFDEIARSIGAGTMDFSHDASSFEKGFRFDEIETSKEKYKESAVVLLVRDPRDVIVSCYFQASKREKRFDGTLTSFLHDERFGIRKCAAFHRIWAENQHVPKRFLLVRYEDMQRDPESALRSVLDVLGILQVSSPAIQHAISFGDFDNMKKLESSGYFNNPIMKPRNADDPESFKVRRGKVGGYRDYLSDSDCAYVNEILAGEGGPFYTPYLDATDTGAVA